MKPSSLLIPALAVAMLSAPVALHAQAPGTRAVSGTIFKDPNFNGRLDASEKGGVGATVFLYRINDNGARVRVDFLTTDLVGGYKFPNIPFGRYFLAVRYGGTKFAVTGRPFRIGQRTNAVVRNVPFMNANTVNRYRAFSPTSNPGGLDTPPEVSPPGP